MRTNSDAFYGDCANVVIINGVKVDYRQLVAQRRAAKAAATRKQRKQRTTTLSKQIADNVTAMLNEVKVFKSLLAYYDNGYKQWGTIASMIMNLKEIRPHFLNLTINLRDINRTLDTMRHAAKRGENVSNEVEKMGLYIDNALAAMQLLISGICKSGALAQFATHECINGEGRRLGLRVLLVRASDAVPKIQKILKSLKEMSSQSDINEYYLNGRRIG